MPDTFSNRLKEAMETNNITQSELCAKTGIPKSALSQYLSGKYNAKDDRIALLAQTLNVHPLWLHGFDLPFDEAQLFFKYLKLDDRDKGKIEEKIDTLLENEKYTQDTPPQNAKAT